MTLKLETKKCATVRYYTTEVEFHIICSLKATKRNQRFDAGSTQNTELYACETHKLVFGYWLKKNKGIMPIIVWYKIRESFPIAVVALAIVTGKIDRILKSAENA